MVAMPELDFVVGAAWIFALAAIIVVQAMLAWMKYRLAARQARMAARLARATLTTRQSGVVVAFRPRPASSTQTPADHKAGA
jgi:hypothetical protein